MPHKAACGAVEVGILAGHTNIPLSLVSLRVIQEYHDDFSSKVAEFQCYYGVCRLPNH